jgi:hypothetical protein
MKRWKRQGNWIPACGGTEVPFNTRTGHKVLYVWQPRSGDHAYLDMGTDIIIPDGDLSSYGLGPAKGHCKTKKSLGGLGQTQWETRDKVMLTVLVGVLLGTITMTFIVSERQLEAQRKAAQP